MANTTSNNIKLGIFTLAGLVFLVFLLYMIGKNRNMFGSNFVLKGTFDNVQGLKPGHNVRFGGIDVGTVKKINIISDTLLEVEMIIEEKVRSIIRKNAIVSIGTDGIVGNKVVNITSGGGNAAMAETGDVLLSRKAIDTDEMLRTLYSTNNDIAIIADGLKSTIARINNSTALWELLNDKGLPNDLRAGAANIRNATARATETVNQLNAMVSDIRGGKGSVGLLLNDTSLAHNLDEASASIRNASAEAERLARQVNETVAGIERDINHGNGTINALLKDNTMVLKLNSSLESLKKGTESFNQSMEALKHNFLLRGYFRKLERKQKEQDKLKDQNANE